jgi:hypothetical protein
MELPKGLASRTAVYKALTVATVVAVQRTLPLRLADNSTDSGGRKRIDYTRCSLVGLWNS